MSSIATEIDRALREAGSAERAVQEKRYLKSALTHYGTGMPALRAVAKAALKAHPALDCTGLLHSASTAAIRPAWSRAGCAFSAALATARSAGMPVP